MLLLTWHGTILRVEQTNRRLTHAPPAPQRAVAEDFRVDLPDALVAPIDIPGGMQAIPGQRPGTVHLRRGEAYLAVEAHAPYPVCTRPEPGDWETLLPLTEAEAETLRRLLGGAWSFNNRPLPAGTLSLVEGFKLQIGDHALDLAARRPEPQPDGSVALLLEAGRITLHPLQATPPPEWELRPAPAGHRAVEVENVRALHATPNSRLALPSKPERVHLPLTASRADADWLYRNPWMGQEPASGTHRYASQAVHETDKFVLLERFVEGMIFGAAGVTNTHGYLGNLTGAMPPNMAREADHIFVTEPALRNALGLHGPHAVFYGGNLSSYYHWIIDAMLPLSLLQPHLPPETKLLLPGTLAQFRANPTGKFDHIEALAAFGFGDMPRVEVPAQLCHVEDVYWADNCFIEQASAHDLQNCRNRALNRLPQAGDANRLIYITRATTRRVANANAVEEYLRAAGFEIHAMEDLTVAGQIELFRHAAFVIGVHGAALANLIFCPQGTKVIELAPDTGYRPFFALISSKLGLTHAILPCPTTGGGFFGDVQVPFTRLRALHRLLERRL